MAAYRVECSGSGGSTSRQGGAEVGVEAHAHGWGFGVRVHVRNVDGKETADVYLTSGSNNRTGSQHLGTYTMSSLEKLAKKRAKAS